jgi:hypothetical protein
MWVSGEMGGSTVCLLDETSWELVEEVLGAGWLLDEGLEVWC